METQEEILFDVEVKSKISGEIIIEDFSMLAESQSKGIYSKEGNDELENTKTIFTYNDSITLNCLNRETQDGIKFIETLIHYHNELPENGEICVFNVKEDGYYTINHIVVPTYNWFKNSGAVYALLIHECYPDGVYVYYKGKFYKLTGDGEEDDIPVGDIVSIKEILEANPNTTNVKRCKIDIVYTGNLQECYMDLCKKLFNQKAQQCEVNTYNRDFVWMTLNIIDYLVGFKQFYEAERLLSLFNKCGTFCKASCKKISKDCGCS